MVETIEAPSIGEAPLVLKGQEEGATYLFGNWLDQKTDEAETAFNIARNEAAESFDLTVDDIINNPNLSLDKKKHKLRSIYKELIELRRDRFEERFPEVGSDYISNLYGLHAFLGIYLKAMPIDEGVTMIKTRYRRELDESFEYITTVIDSKEPGTSPSYDLTNEGVPYRPNAPKERLLGAAAISLFIFGVGYSLHSKLKQRSKNRDGQ